jgi:acetolactate synthase-1/2/3 large subunit
VVHLDIDPSEIDKNVKSTVPVWGDCKETLPMLTALIQQKEHTNWLATFHAYYKEELKEVIHPEINPTSGEITMGEVIRHLNDFTKGEAVIVTDVGQNQMVASRYAKLNKTRSNVTSGGLGTMGFALPAAIGAKYGAPERPVVVIAGDGGFQMTLQELGTIMQNQVDVKIIILNNRFLGMIRQWQEMFNDSRYSFSDLESPDFVALAASYRIAGKCVSDRKELPDALNEMMNSKGSFLLEVMVTKENNVFPMIPQGYGVSEIRLK